MPLCALDEFFAYNTSLFVQIYFCVDEADRIFEMGVQDQLSTIVAALPPSRQSVLCSATLPRALLDFARGGGDAGMAALKEPVEYIRLDAETKISENLKYSHSALLPACSNCQHL